MSPGGMKEVRAGLLPACLLGAHGGETHEEVTRWPGREAGESHLRMRRDSSTEGLFILRVVIVWRF